MAIPVEFRRICLANHIALDGQKELLLGHYVELLLDWNSKVNLISRRDQENVWFSHILHSISPWFLIEIPSGCRVVDIGSGGGLPGIPLAILRSDTRVALLDSIRKKTLALEEISRELSLENVNVVTGRAEDVGRWEGFAGAFDVALARAVAPLKELVKWSRPFLVHRSSVPGGFRHAEREVRRLLETPALVALKGGDLESEVRQASLKTGQRKIQLLPLAFPGSEELGLVEKQVVVVSF